MKADAALNSNDTSSLTPAASRHSIVSNIPRGVTSGQYALITQFFGIRPPPPPPIFTLTSIGGLALWLDAADATTISGTSNVTQWRDKSGNGANASGFGNPTYVDNAVNNLSAVRFNGTSSYFTISGSQLDIASEDFAIFSVIQYTPSSLQLPIIGKLAGQSTEQQWRLTFELSNNFFQIFTIKNTITVQSQDVYTTPGWGLFSGVAYRATSIQAFINGSGLPPGGASTGSLSNTSADVEIGRGWATPRRYFNSDMGEILVYKGRITPLQRQQIEGYLAWKWGLQASLPSAHPYKKAAP